MLSTRIRNGDISYDDGGARFWENSRTWRPPDDVVQKLKKDWASTAYATVEFITDDNGVAEPRVKVTPTDRFWNNCPYPRALASKLDLHNIVLLACHPVVLLNLKVAL